MFKYYYLLILFFCTSVLHAQQSTNAVINTQIYTQQQSSFPSSPVFSHTEMTKEIINSSSQPNYEDVMRSTEQHMKMLENKRKAAVKEVYNDFNIPSNSYGLIHQNYEKAFVGIKEMLEGKEPLKLRKAVFLTEYAFTNTIDYEKFTNFLKNFAYLTAIKSLQQGYTPNDSYAIHEVLQTMLSDTVSINVPGREKPITHYPFRYDFDDFWGKKDWTKMFVYKLLATHSGQCHSMPLLYLLIAEELELDAYLAFSPNHSYIKFKDQSGFLRNFETTCGYLVSDQIIMGSGFVNAAAIKNKVYMDTLSKKETIAHCLNDLAMGYTKIFGYSDTTFILKCINKSLEYFPERNLSAIQLKSNLYLNQFVRAANNNKVNSREEAFLIPEVKKLWDMHNRYYTEIRDKGYTEMPKEAYEDWLRSVEKEKIKQAKQKHIQMIQ